MKELEKIHLKVMEQWNLLKSKGGFKFKEYTDDAIIYLGFLANNKNQYDGIKAYNEDSRSIIKRIKYLDIVIEIKAYHFKNKTSNHLIFRKSKVEPKLKFLLLFGDSLTNEKYWKYLRAFFIKQEQIRVSHEILRGLFLSKRIEKDFLMNSDEIQHFNSLDENITIYRYMSEKEYKNKDYGVCWTLNEDIAKKQISSKSYANEGASYDYGDNPIICNLKVKKENIFAYLKRYNSTKNERVIYIHN